MKKYYQSPEAEIELFMINQIITTSDTLNNDNNVDNGDDGFDF